MKLLSVSINGECNGVEDWVYSLCSNRNTHVWSFAAAIVKLTLSKGVGLRCGQLNVNLSSLNKIDARIICYWAKSSCRFADKAQLINNSVLLYSKTCESYWPILTTDNLLLYVKGTFSMGIFLESGCICQQVLTIDLVITTLAAKNKNLSSERNLPPKICFTRRACLTQVLLSAIYSRASMLPSLENQSQKQ